MLKNRNNFSYDTNDVVHCHLWRWCNRWVLRGVGVGVLPRHCSALLAAGTSWLPNTYVVGDDYQRHRWQCKTSLVPQLKLSLVRNTHLTFVTLISAHVPIPVLLSAAKIFLWHPTPHVVTEIPLSRMAVALAAMLSTDYVLLPPYVLEHIFLYANVHEI